MTTSIAERLAAARSFLFVPGDRPERIAKAQASGADWVIVDLEDAVAPDRKAYARTAVAEVLSAAAPVLLRCNGVRDAGFSDDVPLFNHPGVAGVVLPKTERCADVAVIAAVRPLLPVLPLIETAAGLLACAQIARVPQTVRLMFGELDFRLDMGLPPEQPIDFVRLQLTAASRAAGRAAPVDGVTMAVRDEQQLLADLEVAKRAGFTAKLCIHPSQIDTVRKAFSPTEHQLDEARRVLEAADASGGAATTLDGRMIDLPVIAAARRILEQAQA